VTRLAALAGAAVVAASVTLPLPSASACDPYSFPYCTTYCKAIVSRYELVRDSSSIDLPPVPRTGLAGCP
jgi:hypothetical protein